MLGFPLSREWPTNPRRVGRGRSRGENSISNLRCEQQVEPNAVVTLVSLCLASLESSLSKGLATLHLDELPVGLAEQIYDYIFLGGSRMAKMEVSKALAPILQHHVDRFDCSRSHIGDSALLQLAKGCGLALIHLNLNECPFVADSGILGVMLKCPSIKILSLSGCNRLSDQVAHYLPHRLPGLTRLDLAGVEGITESGVAYISFLPALEQLCLARCKISDAAVVSLGAGVCRHSIRWLDLTGTGVRDACIPSLGNILLLEYIALSSTSTSISAVAALARDLRLPAMLPEARKTRARSNRILLLGSRWSEQHRHAPKRTRRPPRRSDAPLHHEHGGSRRGWAEESKALRLIASANVGTDGTSTYGVHVKIGFREDEEDIERSGRGLVMNLVQGIVDLWPAEPIR